MALPVVFQLLGTFTVKIGGHIWRPRSVKGHALLCYLLLSPQMTVSREKLAGILWSESFSSDARVSLRQVLSGLRRDFERYGSTLLSSDRSTIALSTDNPVETDIAMIEASLRSGHVPDALYNSPDCLSSFLFELDDIDPDFNQWLNIERGALLERVSSLLQSTSNDSTDRKEAARAAKVLLHHDPSNEAACRTLMAYRHADGDTAGALRAYATLWDVLDREFDMEPSSATQSLVSKIKLGQDDVPDQPDMEAISEEETLPVATASCPVLILVHPFAADDLDNRQAGMLRALRHEFIATLVRFKHWSIREFDPSTESAVFTQTEKIYELVPATHFYDGQLSLVLTLRRKLDGHYLWSESHLLLDTDFQIVHRNIVRKVAQALDVQISEERLHRVARLKPEDVDLHDRWLRANALLLNWTWQSEEEALAILEGILSSDPDFAPASAGMAQILNTRHLIYPGIYRDRRRQEKALAMARHAARLAPMDNRIQLTLAWAYLMCDRYTHATTHFEMALKLNDLDPWTLCSAAQGLSYCGYHKTGQRLAKSATDIGFGVEPIHWAYLGFVHYLAGDDEMAVEAIGNSGDSAPFIKAILAASHARLGRSADAARLIEEYRSDVQSKWCGDAVPNVDVFVKWFCHLFPIRHVEDRERVKTGVLLTGLGEMSAA